MDLPTPAGDLLSWIFVVGFPLAILALPIILLYIKLRDSYQQSKDKRDEESIRAIALPSGWSFCDLSDTPSKSKQHEEHVHGSKGTLVLGFSDFVPSEMRFDVRFYPIQTEPFARSFDLLYQGPSLKKAERNVQNNIHLLGDPLPRTTMKSGESNLNTAPTRTKDYLIPFIGGPLNGKQVGRQRFEEYVEGHLVEYAYDGKTVRYRFAMEPSGRRVLRYEDDT